MKNNKKAIVFGSNGYIGRHLVKELISQEFEVEAYDITEPLLKIDCNFTRMDLLNKEELNLISWDVEFIFLFAGLTGTDVGFSNYLNFINSNEIALLNVLDCIKDSNFNPRLVFPSTRLVYEGSEKALKEDSPKKPKTIYAMNKIACENYLDIYEQIFDVPYTIFRICVPYGNTIGDSYSYGTIGSQLDSLKNSNSIPLYGDGRLRRTFTHVDDIIDQIMLTIETEESKNNIFNIEGEDFSLLEVASLLIDRFGGQINHVDWPQKALKIESGSTIFDSSKIHSILDYNLSSSLVSWVKSL